MHCQCWIFGPLVALIPAILARADYIMDDTNSTITYAGDWARDLLPFLVLPVDTSRLFNGTMTYSNCTSPIRCYVTIPFVGSGINVQIVSIPAPLNISSILDGAPPSITAYSSGCLPACYNISAFNNQSLTHGPHTLNISVYSTEFLFDSAVISTPPSSTSSFEIPSSTSSSEIPSSTGHPTPSSHRSSKQLSAIIGGVIGGVGAVIAIVLAILCYRKGGHLSRQPRVQVDPLPIGSSFHSATFISNPPGQVNTASHDNWSPSRDTNLQTNDISPPPIPPKRGIPSVTADVSTSSVYSANQSLPQSETLTAPNPGSLPTDASVASPTTNPRLTEGQLVQELIRHNVPLVTVAGVMDNLLRRERSSGGQGVLESENLPDYTSEQLDHHL